MFRSVSLAALLGLSLCGFAQAQSAAPEPAPATAPPPAQVPAQAPAVRSPQALPTEARSAAPAEARPAPRAERPARAPRRAAREARERRSASYPGGRGSSWKTGRDAYGFAGSYGGCRFRGHAGPNGYRLDRSC